MRLTVTDLVGQPGATRAVHEQLEPDAFGDASWGPADGAFASLIELDLHLDAVVEGILVRGDVATVLRLPCSRCLGDVDVDVAAEVTELFVDPQRMEPDEGDDVEEGYLLLDDATGIDLSNLVRDALLVDLPIRVLCRDDCAGLCPTCGSDLNVEPCGHGAGADVDPRWSPLADLRLPPN